jgi:XTP/dITP diphosphohydrolase
LRHFLFFTKDVKMFSLPKKLLIATNNKGKFTEIAALLSQINIESVPTFQFNITEPEETGATFAENSLLKAKYYAKKTGLTALADDSGLCVEAMNGKPGIYSARFAKNSEGSDDFDTAFAKIFAEITKNSPKNWRAFFICNLSIFDPKTNFEISFEGRVDGNLTFPPVGNQGFGYDPIFIKDGLNKTFGEMSPQEKDQISHRADAFEKLVKWLETIS